VIALEIWDLEIGGATLFAARAERDFPSRLGEAARRLIAGELLDGRCRGVERVIVRGGGAQALCGKLPQLGVPVTVEPGAFAGEAGGLALLGARGGLVVDAGQTAIKLSWPGGRARVERDFASLPANVEPDDGARERVRAFFAGAIANAAARLDGAPAGVVLALPAELDDALVPGACSYPIAGDATLVADVLARAGLDGVPALVLNDAELAASDVPRDRATLVLTVGFGVGGALVLP
jgi:hypothetical protein